MSTYTPRPVIYQPGDRVTAKLRGVLFIGEVTKIFTQTIYVLPDEGQYFSDAAERNEVGVPLSNSPRYNADSRIIGRAD